MTIPNLITIGRFCLVPVVILCIVEGRWAAAFFLFLAAGISDAVDGFLARRFGMGSELGAYIDPLADKALLTSIYVALAIEHVVPNWLAIAVVSRDVMILSAIVVSWLMHRPVDIRPLAVSKINTAAQIGFAVLVLAMSAFGLALGGLVEPWLAPIVAALTVWSAAAYLAGWLRHMAA